MNIIEHISLGAQILQIKLGINDLLYFSSLNQIESRSPLRGGIPVIFPQFANCGNIKKHGFVRDYNWKLVNENKIQDKHFVEYEYQINEIDFPEWKHSAKLNLKAFVIDNIFKISIHILNNGKSSFEFTGGIHPYFKIQSRSSIKLKGLEFCNFEDSFPEIQFNLLGENLIERLYFENNDIYFYNGFSNLLIKSTGFQNWMIWNPGKQGAKKIHDLPDDDWDKFLCIEPIVKNKPVLLNPNDKFKGKLVVEFLKSNS